MKHNQTIPKQYLPRPLTNFGTTSQGETFKTQYKDLFFQHLDKVLIHNQTNLELQQTKLTNIITDTERQLSTSTESTDQITLYYHQFMTNNNITNHQTLPSLKARLTNSATHTTTQKTNSLANTTYIFHQRTTRPTKLHHRHSTNPAHNTKKTQTGQETSNSNKAIKTTSFFRPKLTTQPSTHPSVHNFSTHNLTTEDLQLLNKGLSFAPTPTLPKQTCYLQLLHNFDRYAESLKTQFTKSQKPQTHIQSNTETALTTTIYRPLKFLPKTSTYQLLPQDPCDPRIENYIHTTKCKLDQHLARIYKVKTTNLIKKQ